MKLQLWINKTTAVNKWDLNFEWIRLQIWMNIFNEWDISYERIRLLLWMNDTTAMNE